MGKLLPSLVVSLTLCGALVGGIYLSRRAEQVTRTCEQVASEVSALRDEIQAAREEVQTLAADLERFASTAGRPVMPPLSAAPAAAGSAETALVPVATVDADDIRGYVAATLEQERKLREEERKKQREEFRERAEARRKEIAALSEGPFDRLNLKVNSLAKVLALNDGQKQAYFELAKHSSEKLQAERRKLAEAAGAAGGASPEGRGRGREDRGKAARELFDAAQKEFTQSVQAILSPSQLEVYGHLSSSARNFQSLDFVSPPREGGEDAERQRGGRRGMDPGPVRR